jgi:uncharacterized membrane protein YccC
MDWLLPLAFNLAVGVLLAAYLIRAVRRFERTADRIEADMDRAFGEQMRKYDQARDDIRASMRADIDQAIAALSSAPALPARPSQNGSSAKVGSEAAAVVNPR